MTQPHKKDSDKKDSVLKNICVESVFSFDSGSACARTLPMVGRTYSSLVPGRFLVLVEFAQVLAARAVACADVQNSVAFWKLHDYYFEHQASLTPGNIEMQSLETVSTVPGLNAAAFQRCLASHESDSTVNKDVELGGALEVSGTPTFFVNVRGWRV